MKHWNALGEGRGRRDIRWEELKEVSGTGLSWGTLGKQRISSHTVL